ncbi:energy transducer TonB [Inhella gelatinilytica]|uniref:Energy transducer TonB n=1 Tax=Inhella gelatinilytica TaxID=2795030 RepID=A0A931IW12_9BURK|nr:energy transducer TonB [Inhella gelatinilytica]MBH9552972.1 energy transducer TonB [Inhella gelatinilytica]
MKWLARAMAVGLMMALGVAMASPKVLKKVPPEFPAEAARKGINAGSVKAKLTIGPDGAVTDVEILEAEPKRVFDKASIEALKGWKFEGTGQKETLEIKLVYRNED